MAVNSIELAQQLMNAAHAMLAAKNDDREVEAHIKEVYKLLDHGGGRDNYVGVWILHTEALLADRRGFVADALEFSRLCQEKSDTVFGANNINAVFCLANYAHYFASIGLEQGLDVLRSAITKLELSAPTPEAPQAWINKALSLSRRILSDATRALSPEEIRDLFRRIYIRESQANGIIAADLRKGDSAVLEVIYKSPKALSFMPYQHRTKFKGLTVAFGADLPPGTVIQ